jgi:hypothetical protein
LILGKHENQRLRLPAKHTYNFAAEMKILSSRFHCSRQEKHPFYGAKEIRLH